MWSYWELLTDLPAAEIAARRRARRVGRINPRDVKAELAAAITAQFHGAEAAAARPRGLRARLLAQGASRATSKRSGPILPRRRRERPRVLVGVGLADSMREARRKIAEGALTVFESGSPRVVRDPNEKILGKESRVLRLGRRFLRVLPAAGAAE